MVRRVEGVEKLGLFCVNKEKRFIEGAEGATYESKFSISCGKDGEAIASAGLTFRGRSCDTSETSVGTASSNELLRHLPAIVLVLIVLIVIVACGDASLELFFLARSDRSWL